MDGFARNEAAVDAVVLGCTHYSLIKGKLRKLFPRAKLMDGAKGVAMEVERQLEQREWLGDGEGGNRDYC